MTDQTTPPEAHPEPAPEDPAADAAAAFMAMMRRVHELSNLTAGQIAISSGLPRSTAYRFVDRHNRSLPKHRHQVEAFLRACRLPSESMTHMLTLWDELAGKPIDPVASVEAWDEIESSAPPPQVSEQLRNGFQTEPPRKPAIESVTNVGYLDVDLTAVTSYLTRPRTPAPSACVHPGHCRNCLGMSTSRGRPRTRRRTPAAVQAAVTRVFPLLLLVIALYPMAVTVRFGHLFTNKTAGILGAGAITIGLLLGTSKWVHKPYWRELLTPVRLTVATLTGLAVGVLAWLAVPAAPLVGVLTGFVVFTATPLWIGLTKRANPTSTRGLFVLITSIWCGTVLGFITALAGFPTLGSILAGFLGAAMAAMMLSNNLLEQRT